MHVCVAAYNVLLDDEASKQDKKVMGGNVLRLFGLPDKQRADISLPPICLWLHLEVGGNDTARTFYLCKRKPSKLTIRNLPARLKGLGKFMADLRLAGSCAYAACSFLMVFHNKRCASYL